MKIPNRAEGGYARAKALTPERRREIASQAAKKRWELERTDKKKAGETPAVSTEQTVTPS